MVSSNQDDSLGIKHLPSAIYALGDDRFFTVKVQCSPLMVYMAMGRNLMLIAPKPLKRYTFPTRSSNDKLGVSKKGLSPLDLPPGLIRTVLSSREPSRAQISIK